MGNAFDVRFHCAPFKMKPGRRQKEYPGSVILCYLKLTAPPADVEQITEVRSKEEGERVGERERGEESGRERERGGEKGDTASIQKNVSSEEI